MYTWQNQFPSTSFEKYYCRSIKWKLGLILLSGLILTGCKDTIGSIEDQVPILRELWSIETDLLSSPDAPPLLLGDSLLVYTGHEQLICIRTKDGTEKWRGEIDGDWDLDTYILLKNGNQIASAHGDDVMAWDALSGKKQFEIKAIEDSISFDDGGTDSGYNHFRLRNAKRQYSYKPNSGGFSEGDDNPPMRDARDWLCSTFE